MSTVIATATAASGVPFTVVLVRAGEVSPRNTYGYKPERDVVEFYDTRHAFTAHGQFVADYRVETIVGEGGGNLLRYGLNLHGGVPDWSIDGATMAELIRGIEVATAQVVHLRPATGRLTACDLEIDLADCHHDTNLDFVTCSDCLKAHDETTTVTHLSGDHATTFACGVSRADLAAAGVVSYSDDLDFVTCVACKGDHAAALDQYAAALATAREYAQSELDTFGDVYEQRDVFIDALAALVAAIDNVDATA